MKEKIREILSQRKKRVVTDISLIPAGVLVPLFEKEGEYYILLTKRTAKVEYHKGEISFPGGAYDERDGNLMLTALRETFEELGLRAKDVEILGELDDDITTSNFVVSPFVGIIPYPYEFRISQREIEELIEVPISALLDKNNFREEDTDYQGQPFTSYFYEYQGHVIWGATARILKQFLDLVFGAV